ncbi:hypothetical protein IAR50_000224 [Cryptococcus sp. DSM 104548]
MGAKRKTSARHAPATPANNSDNHPPNPPESATSDDPSASTPADSRSRKRRLDVNPSLIIDADGGRPKRRRSPSPRAEKQEEIADADPKDPARAKELGMRIWQKIMEAQTKDGEPMAEPFVKLPPKRQFPDYYDTIKHPMSLEIVKQRLDKQEYDTLKDVVADLGQIFNNAKRYNVKESALFQWAKKLHKMTRIFQAEQTNPGKAKEESDSEGDEGEEIPKAPAPRQRTGTLPPDADGSSAREDEDDAKLNRKKKAPHVAREGPTVYKLIKPVLKAIKEAKAYDGSGRLVSEVFMQLPDRKDLPDYYKTIKTPISLEEIEAKHSGRRYEDWEELFDDLELMCNNAMEYNTDESAVFQDAKRIKDMFPQQRAETKLRLTLPPGTKLSARQKASAMTPVRVANPHLGYAPQTATANSPVTAVMSMPAHLSSRGGYPVPTPSPGAHHIPQTAYPATSPSYSQSPYHGSHPLPIPGMPQTSSSSYLPALPLGVVTEEVVSSLDRYPPHEQQQWLSSLPPHGVATYRSINAIVEQKRQAAAQAQARAQAEAQVQAQVQAQNAARAQAQAHSQSQAMYQSFPQSQTPSHVPSPSPAARSGASTPALPTPQMERRPPPAQPLISHLDISFTSPSALAGSQQQVIRLRNSRGVVTHCILLDSKTSELEIAAYPDLALAAERGEQSEQPDMMLHLNGVASSTGKVVEKGGTRWTVVAPPGKNESRVEVAVGKGGSNGETITIYLNRQ